MNDEEFRKACELDAESIRQEIRRMKRWNWMDNVVATLALLAIAYGLYLSPWAQNMMVAM